MSIRGLFRVALIAVSYHSMKKVIDRYPEPYKSIVIFLLRLCLFFIVFLSLFSFFTSRIYSITSSTQSPGIIANVLVGASFLFSLVVGFLLTAVVEEMYRKFSEMKEQAGKTVGNMKDTAQAPYRMAKTSVNSAGAALGKAGGLVKDSSKKVYDASLKITGVALDAGISKIKSILPGKTKNKDGEV